MFGSARTHFRRGTPAKLAALTLLLSAAAPASAQNLVNFGDTITDPGVYYLNGNQSGAGTGIYIDSDDVLLVLFRFTLRGDGTQNGIDVQDQRNVNIWGGRVTNFEDAVDFEDSTYCTVKDTRMDHCTEDGLDLDNTDYCTFLRIHTDHNDEAGMDIADSNYNRFLSCRSDENDGDGILLTFKVLGAGSENNTVKKCWFAYNDGDGIHLEESGYNDIEENQCVANGGAGIHLTGVADGMEPLVQTEGSSDNDIKRNWCPANGAGIAIEWGSTDNDVVGNIALFSFEVDMFDGNAGPPCENTWFLNTFLTRGGDGRLCIF